MSSKKQPARRGRKPSPPGAKLHQLTIRLPPSQRLALELLARELGLSISQVVERALSRAVAEWPVDGIPAGQQVLRFNSSDSGRSLDAKAVEALAEEVLDSEPFFIAHLPETLRREDEKFFCDVLREIIEKSGGISPFPINDPDAIALLDDCRAAYRRGTSTAEVVDYWMSLVAESRR